MANSVSVAVPYSSGDEQFINHSVPIPAAPNGSLILMFLQPSIAISSAINVNSGDSQFIGGATTTNNRSHAVFAIVADNESGIINVNCDGTPTYLLAESYVITGWSGNLANIFYQNFLGNGFETPAYNPPALTPAPGEAEYVWFAGSASLVPGGYTGGPAGYTNVFGHNATPANALSLAVGHRLLTAASENPAQFTAATAVSSASFTVAVLPAAPIVDFTATPGATTLSRGGAAVSVSVVNASANNLLVGAFSATLGGQALTITNFSNDTGNAYSCDVAAPAGIELQHLATHDFVVTENAVTSTTANFTLTAQAGYTTVTASGTLVKSQLWETGKDFGAGVEVYAPTTRDIWQSPAGVTGSTVEPAEGVADWVYVRPLNSFLDGWDTDSDEPVAGSQIVRQSQTNGTPPTAFTVAANGTFTIADLAADESANFFFIHTDGTLSPTYTFTFVASNEDIIPDAFSFTEQTNVALSSIITSNPITVSGIDTPSPISIVGGTYSINGGSYTSSSGFVSNGQTVTVRALSSASNSTAVNATLTIGGVSDTFTVTTLAAAASTPGLNISALGPHSAINAAGVSSVRGASTGVKVFVVSAATGAQVYYADDYTLNASGIGTENIDLALVGEGVGVDYFITFRYVDGLSTPQIPISSVNLELL